MKLLKRNINTGKVVKIDSYDAFDEISSNNYGMLQDWDINCFDDFVKFFKEDLGDDIHTGEYTYYLDKGEEVKVAKEAEKIVLKCQCCGELYNFYLAETKKEWDPDQNKWVDLVNETDGIIVCQNCGASGNNIDIHAEYYIRGCDKTAL